MRVMYGMLLFLASCGGGSPDMQNVIPPVQNDNGGCMSANALLLGSGGTPFIAVDAADFDGTNDYMSRGAALTGLSSGKSGIVSLWFRIDGGDGINLAFLTGDANPSSFPFFFVRFGQDASNRIMFSTSDGLGNDSVFLMSTSGYGISTAWNHILISWDAATGADHMYINGTNVSDGALHINNNVAIAYAAPNWRVGMSYSGFNKLNGCMAELYFAPNQYLDFSVEGNRRKFISITGKPVYLGADGSLPTGTAPIMYHHLDNGEAVANFATNRGTGGNFTITGTLDTASTSPSD